MKREAAGCSSSEDTTWKREKERENGRQLRAEDNERTCWKSNRNDERNRGGTRDAFKVVWTSVQPLFVSPSLSLCSGNHGWGVKKKSSSRALSSAYEICRASFAASAWYVKERGGLALRLASFDYLPLFFGRVTRDRGQRPPFRPSASPRVPRFRDILVNSPG